MNYTIVIPSLNPDEKLLSVIYALQSGGFKQIIVVDDGSEEETQHIFETAVKLYGVVLLTHTKNKGKGRALKSAIAHFIGKDYQQAGIITVDADGQHEVNDVIACMHLAEKNPTAVILGCRNFMQSDVPKKSRYGNNITSATFARLLGTYISDTQTGLRVIPTEYLSEMLTVKGERFEYETNALIYMIKKQIPIKEQKIKTVYFEQNSKTSFRPVVDSVRIYSRLMKFFISSGVSFLVDQAAFRVFLVIFDQYVSKSAATFPAIALARVISCIVNFLFNRELVFKHAGKSKNTFYRYVGLVVIQMAVSAVLVYGITQVTDYLLLTDTRATVKIIVDLSLSIPSYFLQKSWVFKDNRKSLPA